MADPFVQCPACQARYRVKPQDLGQTLTCVRCSRRYTAVAADAGESTPPAYVAPARPAPVVARPLYAAADSTVPRATSGMAILSLVFGLFACVPFSGVIALLLGLVAMGRTKPGMARGRGFAIAGTVLGTLGIVWTGFSLWAYSTSPSNRPKARVAPTRNRALEPANRALCAVHLHEIGLAILKYQHDHDDAYPPDLTALWRASPQLSASAFVCPSSGDTPAPDAGSLTAGGHLSYTYMVPIDHHPDPDLAIVYEDDADHGGDGANILFADGHTGWYAAPEAKRLIHKAKMAD